MHIQRVKVGVTINRNAQKFQTSKLLVLKPKSRIFLVSLSVPCSAQSLRLEYEAEQRCVRACMARTYARACQMIDFYQPCIEAVKPNQR